MHFCSYLKELVPVLNNTAKSVIEERMRNGADGRTVIDIKKVFFQVAHQIISQVYIYADTHTGSVSEMEL